MLKFIRRKSPSIREISKYTSFSYPQVRNVLLHWQKEKIIEPIFETNHPRSEGYSIKLTPEGWEILKSLEEIEKIKVGMK